MNRMVKEVRGLYRGAFGEEAAVVARAPGRVEVLGNHTDYNEGFVLSCAIDREIYVAAGPGGSQDIELTSSQFPGMIVSVKEPARIGGATWANYSLGVLAFLREAGMPAGSVRIAIHGNVPPGAGLSSSAALEVSTALALCRLHAFAPDLPAIAKVCQKAEHVFAGSRCGLLDQYSSLFGRKGHLLFIDFRTLEYRTVRVPDPAPCMILTISGVSHSLVESAYNDRRHECFEAARFFASRTPAVKTLRDISMATLLSAQGSLNPLHLQRARHIVGEDERVQAGMGLLMDGNLEAFGKLLYESHESSRVNFGNSCPELDILVEIARGCRGVFGSRLSGGGFGGATLSFVQQSYRPAVERALVEGYQTRTGRTAVTHSAQSADGASVIEG